MRPRNMGKQPAHGVFIQYWPCECGKNGYRSRAEAKKVIKEMRRQGKLRTDQVDAYRCDTDPAYWHVGHSDRRGSNLNDPRVARHEEAR